MLAALDGHSGAPSARSPDPDAELELPDAPRACLLLVDGLGLEQLRHHADLAPSLNAAAADEPLDAAVPTTTATSLASLATGMPPGRHGLLGATIARVDGRPGEVDATRPMSLLKWRLHGTGPTVDLVDEILPEWFQPLPTMIERAVDVGLDPVVVGPVEHAGTGLNRALFRGGRLWPAADVDQLAGLTIDALRAQPRRLVYTYYGRLDATGHHHGVDSPDWRSALAELETLVVRLVENLPSDALLVVTADHGMVDLAADDLVDVDAAPNLLDGVTTVAGEPRFRQVHTDPGAADDVAATWRAHFGEAVWVFQRTQAVQTGWFGERIADRVLPRIGDVVVVARESIGIVQKTVDPRQAELRGHHGSVTDAERHVPLAVISP